MANVISYAYPKGMRGHVEVTADVTYQRTTDGYNRLTLKKNLQIFK